MRQISIYEAPIEINGLLSDYHKGHLWKMPEELWGKVSDWIDMMGIRATRQSALPHKFKEAVSSLYPAILHQ